MTKLIQLKFSKIEYSGNSIGDDIRIEIKILNQFLRVDKTIKVGTTSEINREIGKFETDQNSFEANVRIDDKGKGWLKARIKDSKTIESLPAFLKVKLEYSDDKREHFIPLEGAHRDKLASVKLQDDGSSNLVSGIEHEEVARASYSISKKTFTVNGRAYATIDYKNAPWKKSLYDIEIPDYPHSLGARYEKDAPRAKTWFRIGHSGDRYLHTGGRSLGCITVIETKHWAEIYEVLIKARKGDRVSVGMLEVID